MSSITWNETRQRIRADKQRLKTFYEQSPSGKPLWLLLNHSFLCVYLHRLSHFFFDRNNKVLARFFWHLNLLLTGADISPLSDIGGGLIVKYPLCVIIVGKLGENCTIEGHGGIGGGRDIKDIGAGPGLPVIGNDVYMAMGSFILGPIEIGDGAYIEPKCFVTRTVPAGATVECPQPRQRVQKSAVKAEKVSAE
ncbi:serine O-acetyltransferase [Methylophaga lonarensis]|uniref:serine O-acetyltransferase n=1 Tax=Methylophaga lonarensis TaxID=999151 RepID=UPI003D289174